MELRQLLAILWRRRVLIFSVFIGIVGTAFFGTLIVTPSYDSTAKVYLRQSPVVNSINTALGLQQSPLAANSELSDSQRANYLAIVATRPLIERVIIEENVTRERMRSVLMRFIPFSRPILRALGVDVESTHKLMTSDEMLSSPISGLFFPRPYVEASQYEDSDIIEIQTTSPDPEQAMRISNAIAKAFIEDESKIIQKDFINGKQTIERNLHKSREEYLNHLSALIKYKEQEKTIDIERESSQIIDKVFTLKLDLERTKLDIAKTRISMSQLESELNNTPKFQKASEQLKENEMIPQLKTSLRDLHLQMAEFKINYTEDHPLVQEAKSKIEEAKRLINKEMNKIFSQETVSVDPLYQDIKTRLSNFYSDLAGLEAAEEAYPRAIEAFTAELSNLTQKSLNTQQLQLNLTAAETVYSSLVKYGLAFGVAESMALSNIYLLEPAVTPDKNDPEHRFPSMRINLMIGLLLGLICAFVAALLAEYVDNTVNTPQDLTSLSNLRALGVIRRFKKTEMIGVKEAVSGTHIIQEFEKIRCEIEFFSRAKSSKSFVLISPHRAAGVTFAAVNLAFSFAGSNKAVVLIDANFQEPELTSYFQATAAPGLADYLVGKSKVSDILIPTKEQRVSLIAAGRLASSLTGLIHSEDFSRLLNELAAAYDIILVDTPPLSHSYDPIILGEIADSVILILKQSRTTLSSISRTVDLLHKNNADITGAVVNKSSPSIFNPVINRLWEQN